jgi:anti-sigma B factor antagonist
MTTDGKRQGVFLVSEPTPLSLAVRSDESGTEIVSAAGDIDMASAPDLVETLHSRLANATVVADLSAVAFCDSSGLRTLVQAHRFAQSNGHALRIAAPSAALERVFELTGLLRALPVFPDVASALAG